jgi:hypothetical protein
MAEIVKALQEMDLLGLSSLKGRRMQILQMIVFRFSTPVSNAPVREGRISPIFYSHKQLQLHLNLSRTL